MARQPASVTSANPIKPSDLRGILEYVPMFRGQTFVVALDGSIIAHENLANLLQEIAVLLNLNIRVVLVHGIGRQVADLSRENGLALEDVRGEGPTSPEGLDLARRASAAVVDILGGHLSAAGIRFALTNAVRSTEVGILAGRDHECSGKVDRLDLVLTEELLRNGILPVFSPLAYTRDGKALRLNSDHLAGNLAVALKASKLIFLTEEQGLALDGSSVQNLPEAELRTRFEADPAVVPASLRSKVAVTLEALKNGVTRVHILDGRVIGGLLTEIFDKVGLGTMVHSNEYQQVRPARREDARGIFNISHHAARVAALRPRSVEEIEASINRYFVYEVDEGLIACAMLQPYPESRTCELGAVFVQSYYEGRGVGRKMIAYAMERARQLGAARIFALSTQSASYFIKVCGFTEGSFEDLPPARREIYRNEGRQSRVLYKDLDP